MTFPASDAIRAIYACAAEPSGWPEALQQIADCFGDVGGLLIYGRADGSFATVVSPSLRRSAEVYDRELWWQRDIRTQRALEFGYRDFSGAVTDRHGITEDEIETHPIYTEFLAGFGLRWTASVQVSPQPNLHVGLSVLRASSKEAFSDDELDLLTDLGRHAEQSLRLGLRLIDAGALSLGLGDALDRLAVGAFVIDDDRHICFANPRAQQLQETVFATRNGVLRCLKSADQKRLAAMVQATALAGTDPRTAAAASSPLIIASDGRRFAVYTLPIKRDLIGVGAVAKPSCVVLVVDLAPGQPLDPSLLRDVYGLTLGESRVAALVGAGISPRETASKLSISELTVRSVLKRVFAKLDVSRQAELVELLVRLKTVEA